MTFFESAEILFATSSKSEEDAMSRLSEYLNNMYFA